MKITEAGQFIKADFFENMGGLNTADSPFLVQPDQNVGGYNSNYVRTGAFQKRLGHEQIGTVVDTVVYGTTTEVTKTLAFGLINASDGTKIAVRACSAAHVAGKLQKVDLTAPTFTDLAEDNATGNTDFLAIASTQTVEMVPFNTATLDATWLSGGGMNDVYGIVGATPVVTRNGVEPLAGVTTAATVTDTTGTLVPGKYFYAFSLLKDSTKAVGNATLDVEVTVLTTGDKVSLDLSGFTSFDTTKYPKLYIWRSAVGGVTGFTAGDLINEYDTSSLTTYLDTGTSVLETQLVPRANSIVLDNSDLPTGTYVPLCMFKRRLVTAKDSTLYIGDTNKPESWPTTNIITIPSGGKIIAVSNISFNTPTTTGIDEFLVIHKENEMWVIRGNDYTDWSLQFIDYVGTLSQKLVVKGNGFLAWLDRRGVYIWDGSGKPTYISRPVEDKFSKNGNLNFTYLNLGWGVFYRKENQIIWYLTDNTGEQYYALKLDLRLTLPKLSIDLVGKVMDGVFLQEHSTIHLYSGSSMVPPSSYTEFVVAGDALGKLYRLYNSFSDAGSDINWKYETPFLDFGMFNIDKRFHKVIAWVDDVGDWPLYLDYWSGYNSFEAEKSTRQETISVSTSPLTSLWDIAEWDVAYWDSYETKLRPIVFNLGSELNNAEGAALKLRFWQDKKDNPVTIYGFSILMSRIAPMRK